MFMMSFSSGLPLALTSSTLQAWYTESGVSVITIGFLSLVGQPYIYKFIWAPLMDRYIPPFLGRRRGWILLTQLALVVTIAAMSLLDPRTDPQQLAIVALLVAFFSASQDISLDAYRTDILTPEQRGIASAVWTNGYRIAMIISGAVALMFASRWGWRTTYLIMSALMLVGILGTFIAEEPYVETELPKTLFSTVKDGVHDLLRRKYIFWLLLFLAFYKFGDAFALSLSSVFYLRGLGFSLDQVAWVGKIFGTVASILGVMSGGALMMRWTLYRSLFIFGLLQAFSTLSFLWLAIAGKVMWIFATAVFIENITSGMGTIALFVLLMAMCNKTYTASQFAFLSAIISLARVYVGPVAGYTITKIGWPDFFIISFVFSLLAVLLLHWLRNKIDFNQKMIY